jgi:hypothetical protein
MLGATVALLVASLAMPHTWLGLVIVLVVGYLWGKGVGRREGYRAGYEDGYDEGPGDEEEEGPEDADEQPLDIEAHEEPIGFDRARDAVREMERHRQWIAEYDERKRREADA